MVQSLYLLTKPHKSQHVCASEGTHREKMRQLQDKGWEDE